MVHRLFLLSGFIPVAAAINRWNNSVPQEYVMGRRRMHTVPEALYHRKLHRQGEQSADVQATVLELVLPPSMHSGSVSLFSSALSNDNMPLPIPDEELDTLTSLYQSLGGPEWHVKDAWMSNLNPCGNGTINTTWYGVKCATFAAALSNESSSHVTGLVLPQNNLVGKLPPLLSLQHLVHVDFSNSASSEGNTVGGTLDALCGLGNLSTVLLAYNNITGVIPNCIQSLANATVLNFDHNAIQGTIPDEICRLRNIEELLLRGNHLRGTVPECIGEDLTALRILDCSNYNADRTDGKQSLSGTLPTSFCKLKHLKSLLFQQTQGIHGTIPDCLGVKQPQLQELDLQDNQFSGTLPPSVCQASALQHLYLSENALTGTVPSCLGSLSQLAELELAINQFHGPIHEELCQLSSLEILYLFENALTGTLPSCLGSLSQLTDLDLSINQFHGALPEELSHSSALEILYLYENSLTGTLPNFLGSLRQLAELGLYANYFHGTIPEKLCQSTALDYLLLEVNALTGTIPSCLGSLSQLKWLTLSFNQFHGPIPEELCEASALEILQLNDNAVTGFIPNCLATSFPFLEAILLHNNELTGTLPSMWALPSLISFMLSNNPKLSGSLPPSLFHQQYVSNVTVISRSPNDVLRSVILEGTSIGGTLPAALCLAPQLATLAFSGNELTGSLPGCVTSLLYLETLCISNNHLTSTIPVAIDNMTSLTVLDLSTNKIQGRVPDALGDISHNLDTMHLQLNRLSCDLPASVLNWQASNANVSFNLLDGNLFGCDTGSSSGIFSLSIEGAAGLRNANEQAFDAYSCGNSNYVLPATTIVILAVPFIAWLAVLHCSDCFALQWRTALGWRVNPSTLINELDHADKQLRVLALGVMAAATVAGSVALVLSLRVARSAFECEFMAAPTLANKHESDMRVLSIGVGVAVSVGLVLSLAPWWRRLVSEYDGSNNDYGGIVAEKIGPPNLVEEDAEAWDFDAERMAEAAPQKPTSSLFDGIAQLQKVVMLLLMLVILTIGPNVGYVLVVLSTKLTQQQKLASEMAITLAKTAIGTLLVPTVARKAVDLLVLNGALTFVRFRLRLVIATALSAMTMVVLPVLIVLATDDRCLYYKLKPKTALDTDLPISYCSATDPLTNFCVEYATLIVTSTYKPSFYYDGEVCISAVLSVYAPVFLGVVLLVATLPAGMETIIIPWLAPWCYRNAESSTVARTGLAFLRAVTWNVWPALANAGVLPPNFSLGAAKLDYLAQRVVERAFVQVMTTLLVALTFGIAVPVVGGACAVAAFVQLLHHRHVLGQIVGLGRLEQPAVVPNLMGCTDIPASSAVVIVVTVTLVWVCGIVGYLEPAVIGCMLLIDLCVALGACGIAAWRERSYSKAPVQHQDRAQSTASSDTSRGMLMESLLAEDEVTELSESD